MAITVKVPGSSVMTKGGRKPLYISRDTKGIGIMYQAHSGSGYSNGTADTSPNAGATLAPGAAGCSATAATDGSFSCTVYAQGVPVGYDDFRFTLWNAAPAGCTNAANSCSFAAAGDKALSVSLLANYAVLQGQSNVVALPATISPVVDSIAVNVSAPIVNGASSTTTASVVFRDAAGSIIIGGDALLDTAGAALTTTLNIANDVNDPTFATCPAAGAGNQSTANHCALNFGAGSNPTITHANDAAATGTTVSYDGLATFPTTGTLPQVTATVGAASVTLKLPATIGVTSSSAGAIGVPAVPQKNFTPAVTAPSFIASASDNNLYVVSSANSFEQVIPGTGAVAAVTAAGAVGTVAGLAAGSDTYLWWTDSASSQIKREALGTGPVAGTFGATLAVSQTLGGIVAGGDGNMYAVGINRPLADSEMFEVNPNNMNGAAPTVINLLINALPVLAAGTFANGHRAVCYTDGIRLACLDLTAGGVDTPLSMANAVAMAFGPDGILYVATSAKTVQAITLTGTTLGTGTLYPTSGTLNAVPAGITAGKDGAMWVTEGTGKLARIAIGTGAGTANAVTEYTLANVYNAAATTANLNQIVLGSDGNLWTSDTGSNALVQITP